MTEQCIHWWCDKDWVIAYSTVALTAFTGLLFVFTFLLWRATAQTLKLGREEFISTHRPRLIVRNVVLNRPNTVQPWLAHDWPPTGQFYVENIGETEATIVESHCVWFSTKAGLPMKRPYEGDDGNNRITPGPLQPGTSMTALFDAAHWETAYATTQGLDSYAHWVMGWIEYRDAAGSRYRMAFCRNWDDQAHRFRKVDDPDYEHG